MARPSLGAGENYRDSYASSSFDKEGYGGAAAGLGAGALAGGAAAASHVGYDPQGRSGARFAARQEMTGGEYGGQGYITPAASTGGKKKWWIIGGVALAIAAIVAIAVGVTVGRKSGSGSGSSSNIGKSVDVGDDPSVFDKDPNLHNSL
jgi:hypothetical protein